MAAVLVTGGTGFLAAHTIAALLVAGHDVRTTVRSMDRRADVEQMLGTAGAPGLDRVSYAIADLLSDDGWTAAVKGMEYVLHIASPFPGARPRDENELIVPARDGSLRVLRAARGAGVKRVVMTSSFAAIGYGRVPGDHVFTEQDWTDLNGPGVAPYIKSKTIAERAAWNYIEQEGGALELSVVNPVGIFGPILGPDYSSSIKIIAAMLEGGMRVAPPVWTQVVDVRDVADAHVRAMTSPAAAGQRFIATAGEPLSFLQIAQVLRSRLGAAAAKAPTRAVQGWLVKALAPVIPRMRELAPQVNIIRRASNAKTRDVLGWQPRTPQETVVASAQSLVLLARSGPVG